MENPFKGSSLKCFASVCVAASTLIVAPELASATEVTPITESGNAAQFERNEGSNIEIHTDEGSTPGYLRKTIVLTGYTAKKTGGSPEIVEEATGKSVGFLPAHIQVANDDGHYDVTYKINDDRTVSATAVRHGTAVRFGWKCATKNTAASTAGGAAGGTILGLAGGPFAEITVPAGALGGAIEGFTAGVANSIVNC